MRKDRPRNCAGLTTVLVVLTLAAVAPAHGAAAESGEASRSKEASGAKPDDGLFSGPQVGEPLPGFSFQRMFGKNPSEVLDPVKRASGKPVVVIFVHKVTRPGIAAIRVVTKFLGKKKPTGITAAVVFLTDDPTSTVNFMKRARRALPSEVPIGYSRDGIEGPGAYGLNRQVELTVLVANQGKVTANLALVQPSMPVDVPKILKAIVAQVGGKVPTLASLGVTPRRGRAGLPAEVANRVRQLIQTRRCGKDGQGPGGGLRQETICGPASRGDRSSHHRCRAVGHVWHSSCPGLSEEVG